MCLAMELGDLKYQEIVRHCLPFTSLVALLPLASMTGPCQAISKYALIVMVAGVVENFLSDELVYGWI